jgi:hypothetical protein
MPALNLRRPALLIPLALVVGVAVAVGLYLTHHLALQCVVLGLAAAAAVYVLFQPGGPMPKRRS